MSARRLRPRRARGPLRNANDAPWPPRTTMAAAATGGVDGRPYVDEVEQPGWPSASVRSGAISSEVPRCRGPCSCGRPPTTTEAGRWPGRNPGWPRRPIRRATNGRPVGPRVAAARSRLLSARRRRPPVTHALTARLLVTSSCPRPPSRRSSSMAVCALAGPRSLVECHVVAPAGCPVSTTGERRGLPPGPRRRWHRRVGRLSETDSTHVGSSCTSASSGRNGRPYHGNGRSVPSDR